VLYRADPDTEGGHALLMAGWPGAAWHLELVGDPEGISSPAPTEEDLLVLYVGAPIDDALVERLVNAGGKAVPARNPYWDRWSVTRSCPHPGLQLHWSRWRRRHQATARRCHHRHREALTA
jgi:hypothetical protein